MTGRPVDLEMLTQLLERLREENLAAMDQLLVSTHERIHALETVLMISLRVIEQHTHQSGLLQTVLREAELMQAEHVAELDTQKALGECIDLLKLFSRLRLEPLPLGTSALRK